MPIAHPCCNLVDEASAPSHSNTSTRLIAHPLCNLKALGPSPLLPLKRVNGAPVPSSLQRDNEPSGFLRVNEAHWPPSPQSRQRSPGAQSPRITTHFQLERDNEPPAFSTSTGPIADLLRNLVDKALGPSPHLERVSKAPPSCTSNTPTRPHRLAFSALNATPTPPLQ